MELLKSIYLILFTFQAQNSAFAQRTSTRAGTQFRLKTMCTCLFSYLDSYETISCDRNQRLNILNAYVFDAGRLLATNSTCSPKNDNTQAIIRIITDDLDSFCWSKSVNNGANDSPNNCSISETFLISAKGAYNLPVNCLSADVFYTCVLASATNPMKTTLAPSYSFTYFFYIITLLISSTCVLIGVVFLIKRFLLLRQRHSQMQNAYRAQQHGGLRNGSVYQTRFGNEANESNLSLWTTAAAFRPPSYDRINEASRPINANLPPSYDNLDINNNNNNNKNQKSAQLDSDFMAVLAPDNLNNSNSNNSSSNQAAQADRNLLSASDYSSLNASSQIENRTNNATRDELIVLENLKESKLANNRLDTNSN